MSINPQIRTLTNGWQFPNLACGDMSSLFPPPRHVAPFPSAACPRIPNQGIAELFWKSRMLAVLAG